MSRRAKYLLPWCGVAAMLLAVGIWGCRQRSVTPAVTIPIPVMPAPNAFDFYVKAAEAIPVSLPSYSKSTALTPDQIRQLLEQRQEVTAVFQQGTAHQYLAPPIRSDNTPISYSSSFRNIARYFAFLAKTDAGVGKWGSAMTESLRAVRLGNDVQRGTSIIGALVGAVYQKIGRKEAWELVDHLTVKEARDAIAQLETINTTEVPFVNILQEEKWIGLASVQKIFNTPGWQRKYAREYYEDQQNEARLRFYLTDKRRTMALLTDYYDRCIAIAGQPYHTHLHDPPLPDDLMVKAVAPMCKIPWAKLLSVQTANRLLVIALALHAFHLETGRYPASLQELVTAGYLHLLPADPFAASGAFRYTRKGSHFTLYSIGPDGKDDGGRPIRDPKNIDGAAQGVMAGSKGDIVFGENKL